HWTYDLAGHQASQVAPVNTTPGLNPLDMTFWSYDAGGRLTSAADQPSLIATDRHTDVTYDGVGRTLTAKTYQGAGTGTLKLQTTTTYLGDGQASSVAYAENGSTVDTITSTYDTAGRPDLVQRSGTTLTDFGWNADGTLA